MDKEEFREAIEKLKDELRKQTNFWSHQLRSDRAMSLALQRRAESIIEKSKIIQKIRINHAEKLLNDIEVGKSYAFNLVDEIQTYWKSILPEIKEVLRTFTEINRMKQISDNIAYLRLPEELNVTYPEKIHEPEPEPPTSEEPCITTIGSIISSSVNSTLRSKLSDTLPNSASMNTIKTRPKSTSGIRCKENITANRTRSKSSASKIIYGNFRDTKSTNNT